MLRRYGEGALPILSRDICLEISYLSMTESLEIIVTMSIISMASIFRHVLLATAIDPIAVQIQGIPVSKIGKIFSIITAIVVVSMVQFVGALLVTALLGYSRCDCSDCIKEFQSCLIWAQVFGHHHNNHWSLPII